MSLFQMKLSLDDGNDDYVILFNFGGHITGGHRTQKNPARIGLGKSI